MMPAYFCVLKLDHATTRPMILKIAFAAPVLSLFLASACQQQRQATLRIEVTKDGQPVPGAQVSLFRRVPPPTYSQPVTTGVTNTDSSGRFSFGGLKPDAYNLEISINTRDEGPCEANAPEFMKTPAIGFIALERQNFTIKAGEDLNLKLDVVCPLKNLHKYISEHVKEYESLSNSYRNQSVFPPDVSGKDLYLSGKVLVVHKDGIDGRSFLLPHEIIAKDSKEIGTIAFLSDASRVVGMYTGGAGPAVQERTDLTFIDVVKKKVIGLKTFEGSGPPAQIENKGIPIGGTGTLNPKAIENFIVGLPRR